MPNLLSCRGLCGHGLQRSWLRLRFGERSSKVMDHMPRASSKRREPQQSPISATGGPISASLLDSLPDAIIAVDRAGTIIQVSSQTEHMFGYDRDELLGQKIEILVPERYRSQHSGHRQRFAEAAKTRRMGAGLDLYGRHRNGTEFPVEISLSPVTTSDGTI